MSSGLYKKRSNVLIEHVLSEQKPAPGDTWRLRKGTRRIILDLVFPDAVQALDAKTGRRTTITLETLISRYVKEE